MGTIDVEDNNNHYEYNNGNKNSKKKNFDICYNKNEKLKKYFTNIHKRIKPNLIGHNYLHYL